MSAKNFEFLVHLSQNYDPVNQIEREPSFNGRYFQISRISEIWFNEHA